MIGQYMRMFKNAEAGARMARLALHDSRYSTYACSIQLPMIINIQRHAQGGICCSEVIDHSLFRLYTYRDPYRI